MGKFINVPDLVLIGVSAYLFVWGSNHILRGFNKPSLQA